MALGLGLGRVVPGMDGALARIEVGGVSLPIALGLLVMMYPVLAKVRYDRLGTVIGDRGLMASSLVVNWIAGPAVMFALAWIFLPDLPEYRTGLIVVGLARCIAMVIIWNDLACGDREAAAVLVALNSVFQVVAFGLLGWFYLDLLPRWLGLGDGQGLDVPVAHIALNVVVFLGVPLLAGFLTRRIGERRLGRRAYETAPPGPAALAPLIDPNQHSCGSVRPHGHRELSHPEQGVHLVGMKSYGRAPTFLAMTGYEQVRSVAAALAGDIGSADRVELTLPETGVCGGAGLFDDPAAVRTGEGCCGS
nr:hypothetical protein OG284_09475 [Streptomyces sp. NBC_01177]